MPATHDRILPLTRLLAAVIVPILVAAFLILYWDPAQNGLRFAWPVAPSMTAMMLGATYLGGAWFFLRVATISDGWHRVRLGFLPVTAFAAIMGVATILHWDRFTHDSPAFWLWAALYFSLPILIPATWLVNERAAPDGRQQAAGPMLERRARAGFAVLGGLLGAAAAVLLATPDALIPAWPWTLTPLTGRAMAAMFALSGIVGVSIALDGRHAAASIVLQAQALAIGLMLVGALRATTDLAWGDPGTWLFLAAVTTQLLLALASLRLSRPA